MAYNTRSIKKDVDGRPIPQYFNQMTDNYEPLLGENGAARSVLYGPDGQPISSSNRLPVDVGGAVDISDRADRRLGQVTLSGRATLVAMGLNEVIPPGVEIFRPATNEAPVVQAHRRYGFILTFVAAPEEKRRVRVNLALRRLTPNGSKNGSAQYVMGDRVNVLVADGSRGTPLSLIMEPVHVPAEWFNFGVLNTGTEDVTVNWYVVEV